MRSGVWGIFSLRYPIPQSGGEGKRMIETYEKRCASPTMISSVPGLGGCLHAMCVVDRLPSGKNMLSVEAKLALIIVLLALVYLYR